MKKTKAAILIFDTIAGLLLFCLIAGRLLGGSGIAEVQSRRTSNPAETAVLDGNAGEAALGGKAGNAGETALAGRVGEAASDSRTGDRKPKSDDDVPKKIALTFDDGPHPSYTEQLLDGLLERGVHVTFFVTGEHAALHPDIILRMRDDA